MRLSLASVSEQAFRLLASGSALILNWMTQVVAGRVTHSIPAIGPTSFNMGARRSRALMRIEDARLPRPQEASRVLFTVIGAVVAAKVPLFFGTIRPQHGKQRCRRQDSGSKGIRRHRELAARLFPGYY
jgi:hypothetical protein